MLTSHMHRHGIRFVIERLNGEVIYESDDWAHSQVVWFDPPLEDDSGVPTSIFRNPPES